MKKLTIIMPHLNEEKEPFETIRSIHETSDPKLSEIIAIDDCSSSPIDLCFSNVKQIRNEKRIGVDASRQLGVELSETDNVLVIDSHMRFKNDDWLPKMIHLIENNQQTLWCCVCLGLGYGTLDVNNHKGKYYGANILFIDKEASPNRPARECLECKWATDIEIPNEYQIQSILGANYFFSKKWFDYINGWKGLRMWGSSEPFVSLKSYMASGDCKITKDIEIGHVFRSNAPYATGISHLVYNKMFLCKTILPDELGSKLISHLPKDINFNKAMEEINKNQKQIEEDKLYYKSIFKKSIYDYCDKFRIDLSGLYK